MAQGCPYTIDTLVCRKEFAHEGRHEVYVAGDREVTWFYADAERKEDVARGYVACFSEPPSPGQDPCYLPVGHDRAHENADMQWGDDDWYPQQGEPEKPQRDVSEGVRRSIERRSERPTRLIAINLGDGQVDRREVVNLRMADNGTLVLKCVDADIVYAPGAWKSYSIEPIDEDD